MPRPARRSRRTVRPGLLAACAVALLGTAGVRVAVGGDDATPSTPLVEVPTTAPRVERPAGVDPVAVPDRNPFGTPGGPATVTTDPVTGAPVTVPTDPEADPATADGSGPEDVATSVAPGR